ncbi:MAG TPA: DUF3570 domain-containing protein [Kofleriaceae bacterium]|nr:DUF3570 domain-containing protein [Kofleriaceae bacterium]
MRLQLKWTLLGLAIVCAARIAHADDRAEVSTSVFAEQRAGDKGGLRVIHPQADIGTDIGKHVTLDLGYAADAVSGATATTYQVDATTGATKFSDTRHEGNLALGFHGRRSSITFSSTVGTERDYLSREFGGAASIDLPGRNTTVALAYSHSFDTVCDKDNADLMPLERRALVGSDPCNKTGLLFGKNTAGMTVWRDLSIDTAQTTITQNLSPTMNMQLALFGQILEGYQSNPYRRVRIGSNSPQEHIPDTRDRWSVTARLNRYLPKLHGAAHFSARFYDDTWRVIGGDVELAYSQYIGTGLLAHFRVRAYQQTAAKFFKDAFYYETESTAGEYFTGDRELSPVRSALAGAKLTLISVGEDKPVWGMFDKLQFNLKADLLMLFPVAADDLANNPMGIDKQFLNGQSLVDAFVLQLGLLGNY